jgi:hypothetical protein
LAAGLCAATAEAVARGAGGVQRPASATGGSERLPAPVRR